MDFLDICISSKQAKEFAKVIFSDIQAYVETHQEEYNEFLSNEMNLDNFEE